MDSNAYLRKMKELLDYPTYKRIDKDLTCKVECKVVSLLKPFDLSHIST